MEEVRIPKIIHYCWFGRNPLNDLAVKCIDSWRTFCPDYQIIEWNEDNFDVNQLYYTKEAYDLKKWAFVSDVARLFALVNYGGIYMDTDVELLKPLDELLEFDAVSGFEKKDLIPTGLMASKKNHPIMHELLDEYRGIHFVKENGEMDITTNCTRITKLCVNYGLLLNNSKQTIKGFTLLPNDYLCPKSYETGKINITNNTICIHHFNASWVSEEDRYAASLSQKLTRYLPNSVAWLLGGLYAGLKYRGPINMIKRRTLIVIKHFRKDIDGQ